MNLERQSVLCSQTRALGEIKSKHTGEVFNESQSAYYVNKARNQTKTEIKVVEAKSDRTTYNFELSEFENSWQVGNGTYKSYANAFKDGVSACPEDLIIPRTLKDENGVEKEVAVIGQYAFCNCACLNCSNGNGKTKRLTLTRNVKVIKKYGLGYMNDLETFIIEKGSVLGSVESRGMDRIGYNTGNNDPTKRGILTLPSSLSSVAQHGFNLCNLFKIIVYCGSHPLKSLSRIDGCSMNVTSRYPARTSIFGRFPSRRREDEEAAEIQCASIQPTGKHTSTELVLNLGKILFFYRVMYFNPFIGLL